MPVKNEPVSLSDFLKHEAANLYSRDQVTVLSGQNLAAGTVVGKVAVGAVTGAADAGNTVGSGGISALSAGIGAQVGVYTAVCIEPATNAGKFEVADPLGNVIGVATVGVAFTGQVNFTIADATDFVSGDLFRITVAAGSNKVKASPDTASDGSAVAIGVLAFAVDASSADQPGVIIARQAVVSPNGLTYDATVNDSTKKGVKLTQLAALGIINRVAA